jgi:hypothetical protein
MFIFAKNNSRMKYAMKKNSHCDKNKTTYNIVTIYDVKKCRKYA